MRNSPGQPEGRTGVVTGNSGGKVKDQSRAGNALLRVAHYACFERRHEKLAGRNTCSLLEPRFSALRQDRIDTPQMHDQQHQRIGIGQHQFHTFDGIIYKDQTRLLQRFRTCNL